MMKKNQATLRKTLPMWHLRKWGEGDILLSKECIIFLYFLNQLSCLFREFSYLEKNIRNQDVWTNIIVSHQATPCVVFTNENFTNLVKWCKDFILKYVMFIYVIRKICFWFIFVLFCTFPQLAGVPSPIEHHSLYSKNNIGKGNNVHKFILE